MRFALILAVFAFGRFFEGEVGRGFLAPLERWHLFLVELLVGEDAGQSELGGIGLGRLGVKRGEGKKKENKIGLLG